MYELSKPMLEKSVAEAMAENLIELGLNTTQTCQLFEKNGIEFAESLHFSKILPDSYKLIHNTANF